MRYSCVAPARDLNVLLYSQFSSTLPNQPAKFQEEISMKLTWMLFGFVVAMCLVVGIAVSLPNAEGGYGIANASHRAMLCTGSQQDDGFVRVLGCLMGLFQLSFLVGCLVLGLRCLRSEMLISTS